MDILFENFNILPQTQKALKELNFLKPTDIQNLVISEMIKGYDIIGQAQTGTGKTFAFGIPIIEKIDLSIKKTQSLILCPTRELALQVFQEFKKLIKFYEEIKIAVIYGGESYIKQFKVLENKPHIIIATPGRVIDLLERKKIDFSGLKILTLDEADEMLNMGFQEALETILQKIPKKRQTVLFSATLPPTIQKIANKYQNDPKILKVYQKNIAVSSVQQFYFLVKEFDKLKLLVRLLDLENPNSVIIFANTKKDVDLINAYLQENNFSVDFIHGDLKQNQRQQVMNNFRNQKIKILIATDVAARGIDISSITMVINYDLSRQNEVYVHRIGRTGRAGLKGLAYSFVTPSKLSQLKSLENYLKEKLIFQNIPKIKDIQEKKLKNFQEKIFEIIKNNSQKDINDELIQKLLDNFDNKQIIKALLNFIIPVKRDYKEIAEINNLKTNFVNKNLKRISSSRNMLSLSINLGKKDMINPALLLKILHEKFNIYSKYVGNIKHLSNESIFEIPNHFWVKIKNKKNIFFNNKILKINQSYL
ncbi:MAG: DEAD/DEAH box helicase [Candidatus Phytoplasma pyri]